MPDSAWLYLAVSSSPQEATLEDQQLWAEGTARTNGWEIERIVSGVSSGKGGARKLLAEMLEILRKTPKRDRPNRILTIRLDRFGRGLGLDAIAALAEIHALGVMVHTREDGDLELARASDAIKPILRVLTGALENEARRDKSLAAHRKRRAEGKRWAAPYGFRLTEHRQLEQMEPHASIIRKIYEMRATGAGYERIARRIKPEAPPKIGLDGSLRHLGWHRTLITYIVGCETYRGTIISEELWDRVQLVSNPDFKQLGTRKWPWPLGGAVRCYCGAILSTLAGGGNCGKTCKPSSRSSHRHNRIRYYRCNDPLRHAKSQKPVHARADRLEAQFIVLLHRLASQPDLVDDHRRSASKVDTAAVRSQLRDVENALESIENRRRAAWDLQAGGTIAAAELSERLESLRAAQSELEEQRTTLKRSIAIGTAQQTALRDAGKLFAKAADSWADATVEEQREIARLVSVNVDGLFVDPDGWLHSGADRERKKRRDGNLKAVVSC